MPERALDVSRRSKIMDTIGKLIQAHFGSTLGRESDIVKVFNALIFLESSYNVFALGKSVRSGPGTGGGDYINSSVIQALYKTGTPQQLGNIGLGLRGIGLTQVMGWNFVKRASGNGVCELDRLRPDLSPSLTVEAGEDMRPKILGESNTENSILAGLIILEGKYGAVQSNTSNRGFIVRGDPYKRIFTTKLTGAVAAYLGLGRADENNTTPQGYSSSIVGGRSYNIANGAQVFKYADSTSNLVTSNGPITNGSSQSKIASAGCTPRTT